MLGLKLNHVSKRGHWSENETDKTFRNVKELAILHMLGQIYLDRMSPDVFSLIIQNVFTNHNFSVFCSTACYDNFAYILFIAFRINSHGWNNLLRWLPNKLTKTDILANTKIYVIWYVTGRLKNQYSYFVYSAYLWNCMEEPFTLSKIVLYWQSMCTVKTLLRMKAQQYGDDFYNSFFKQTVFILISFPRKCFTVRSVDI